jgi:hypothetical protein
MIQHIITIAMVNILRHRILLHDLLQVRDNPSIKQNFTPTLLKKV